MSTDNLSNAGLEALVLPQLGLRVEALSASAFVELTPTVVIVHR